MSEKRACLWQSEESCDVFRTFSHSFDATLCVEVTLTVEPEPERPLHIFGVNTSSYVALRQNGYCQVISFRKHATQTYELSLSHVANFQRDALIELDIDGALLHACSLRGTLSMVPVALLCESEPDRQHYYQFILQEMTKLPHDLVVLTRSWLGCAPGLCKASCLRSQSQSDTNPSSPPPPPYRQFPATEPETRLVDPREAQWDWTRQLVCASVLGECRCLQPEQVALVSDYLARPTSLEAKLVDTVPL